MLDNFLFNVKHGINHVLDIHAYDHILFLIMLSIPFVFKDWKRVIVLVTVFTLGDTLSLILATYNVVRINSQIVEFLIPITILIVAVYNIFTAGKGSQKEKIGLLFITTLFFGLIHGLGFAREFEKLQKPSDNKFILLLEFALGIEIAQIIIVFLVLFISYVVQTIFRFTKRDWVMIISAIVVGLTIPMILNNPIF